MTNKQWCSHRLNDCVECVSSFNTHSNLIPDRGFTRKLSWPDPICFDEGFFYSEMCSELQCIYSIRGKLMSVWQCDKLTVAETSRVIFMVDCIVLQLFFWICSFPALTLFCIIINFRLICSSHVVVMLQWNIISVLDYDVYVFYFRFSFHYCFTAFIAFIILPMCYECFSVWN